MSGPEGPDEFDWIDRLRERVTAPEALGLMDDAAVVPSRPGYDLVISKDMLVEGVHFLPDIAGMTLAWRAVAVAVSDIVAKGAAPYGFFLGIGWPPGTPQDYQDDFIEGLKRAQESFGAHLFGGDTISTPDRIVISVTVLGWVAEAHAVRRDQARSNTQLMVSGTVGDAWLGLLAAKGELTDIQGEDRGWLTQRFLTPDIRVGLDLTQVDACADISDGLVADAGHIARASGVGMYIELERVPLSAPAEAWLDRQPDRQSALIDLVTHGDDYELVATGLSIPEGFTAIGMVVEGQGIDIYYHGRPVTVSRTGWRHGKDG